MIVLDEPEKLTAPINGYYYDGCYVISFKKKVRFLRSLATNRGGGGLKAGQLRKI